MRSISSSLSTSQVSGLNTTAIGNLTTTRGQQPLTSTQVADAHHGADRHADHKTKIQAFSTTQANAITATQLGGLTTTALGNFSTTQLDALTGHRKLAVLTTPQLNDAIDPAT